MDTPAENVVEVRTDDATVSPDDANATTNQQQATQNNDLTPIADALKTTDDNIASVGAKLDEGIGNLSDKLDLISNTQGAISEQIRSTNEQATNNESQTVIVDDAQWSEMQQAWWQAKDTIGAAFFLELVIVLLLSATLGVRIWDCFSRGWRR